MVVDTAKVFEKVQLKVVWAWATHSGFLPIIFGCCTSITSEGCFSKGVWLAAAHRTHLSRIETCDAGREVRSAQHVPTVEVASVRW